jgi:putative FmdB family regulatory protein
VPIYEYICLDCRKLVSLFLRSNTETAVCPQGKDHRLKRIMSRFSSVKSEEDRMESLADPSSWGGLDENDPRSVERFIRKMGNEMGDEVSRDEIDQMADEAAREAAGGSSGDTDDHSIPSTGLDD